MNLDLDALKTTAVFLPQPHGLLEITGETRLDLIDRMSTNRVKYLTTGQGTATILTSEIGRTIDRLLLYADETRVLAVTGPNNSDNIARYLMRFVFFNDDFQMKDVSAEKVVLGVYGGEATAVLTTLGFDPASLPLHHWQPSTHDTLTGSLHRTDPIGDVGYFLIVPQAQSTAWADALSAAGAQAITPDVYQQLRVQAGLPQLGAELSLDFIPLETNLWADVSFNKGCYIGQEIIARMESRGRVAKKLVQFHLPDPAGVTAGTDILAGEKTAGILTSVAGSYGLGYVKTAVLNDPPTLTAANQPLQISRIFERDEPEPEST